MPLDKRNLAVRALSGIIYIGIIIGSILWDTIGVTLLVSIMATVGIWEMETMADGKYGIKWRIPYVFDSMISLTAIWSVAYPDIYLSWICLLLIGLRVLLQIFIKDNNGITTLSISCFSTLYLTLPLICFVILEKLLISFGMQWILVALISMIWINDTGAFLVGCTIGRHRLYEALSPKKSWEGFWGGMIFNIGAGIGYFFIFSSVCTLNGRPLISGIGTWILIGICVTVAATIGDLFESMIKRNFGVKDSGRLIPGHGGILDRIDSILFVTPVLLFLLCVFIKYTKILF